MKAIILIFASIYCACAAAVKCVVHVQEVSISEKIGIAPPDNTITILIVGFFCISSAIFAYVAYVARQSK